MSWTSPILVVWLWHALFDGTFICRCQHSKELRNGGDTDNLLCMRITDYRPALSQFRYLHVGPLQEVPCGIRSY